MITVVTGFPRSGTSMMMKCLECAGVHIFSNPSRDLQMQRHVTAGYNPNPHGYFEVLQSEFMSVGFTDRLEGGMAVKLPLQQALALGTRHAAQIIIMHRDPAEIRESNKRAWPSIPFDKLYPTWPASSFNIMNAVRSVLLDRKTVKNIFDIDFSAVHADPRAALGGLPFDIEKLALGVDRELYRNKAA